MAISTPVCQAQFGNKRDLEVGAKRPWFCHGLDCPKYKVVETTDAYEVREYEEGERSPICCSIDWGNISFTVAFASLPTSFRKSEKK